MRLRAVYASTACAAAAEALALADDEQLPDRIYALGPAALAVAAHLAAERETTDEAFVDQAAAYLLEEQGGPPPERNAAPAWLPRVHAIGAGDDVPIDLQRAERGVELLGRIVIMAAAREEDLEEGELQNANVWLLGGDEPRGDAEEGRMILSGGDYAAGGGVLDVTLSRGVVTASVRRDGQELLHLEYQLRASTKMSVRG